MTVPFIGLSGLPGISFEEEYRTGEHDPVSEFYEPCLARATTYRRAVGYFRSTVFNIIGPKLIEFVRRGGKIRIVCSASLTQDDIETIDEAYQERVSFVDRLLQEELDNLLLDSSSAYRTRVLGTLIKIGALDVRVALRPKTYGIYHEKIGVFDDALKNRVSFKGSANESYSGWHEHGTFESIDVFCSWIPGKEVNRVAKHHDYFERLWKSKVHGLEVCPLPDAARDRLIVESVNGLDDIDATLLSHGRSRTKRQLYPHQSDALTAWRAQDHRGILNHATGSGKTVTALFAIREHVMQDRPALILVPSRLLLNQWHKEALSEIPTATIVLAGAGHDDWRGGLLKAMTAPNVAGPRIVIATMMTAASDQFLLQARGGDHLLLVADEVHQIGSPQCSRALSLDSGPRLGLSATPERYGDPDGTARILQYFGSILQPPFTLQDAIRAKRLVPYEYHPHPIQLSDDEATAWNKLSDDIRKELGKSNDLDGPVVLTERAKFLLIKRARIAKKAQSKIGLATRIIEEHYRPGQRWLIYCEDQEQLKAVLSALRAGGVNDAMEYFTGMPGNPQASLDYFEHFAGILVSIRCLDEGVDIPAVSHALILASSQNPRQFIQRRGRVLRRADGKHLAVIHDAIVATPEMALEPRQFALTRAEFRRAIEFAEYATNAGAATKLRGLLAMMGLDLELISDIGMEEDLQDDE